MQLQPLSGYFCVEMYKAAHERETLVSHPQGQAVMYAMLLMNCTVATWYIYYFLMKATDFLRLFLRNLYAIHRIPKDLQHKLQDLNQEQKDLFHWY